jgi:hypothetical protein
LANDPKADRARAEARFKKPTQEDKAKAMADYEAEMQAVRDRSARLKALRLAKEAEDEKAAAAATAARKTSAKRKAAAKKPAGRRTKSQ